MTMQQHLWPRLPHEGCLGNQLSLWQRYSPREHVALTFWRRLLTGSSCRSRSPGWSALSGTHARHPVGSWCSPWGRPGYWDTTRDTQSMAAINNYKTGKKKCVRHPENSLFLPAFQPGNKESELERKSPSTGQSRQYEKTQSHSIFIDICRKPSATALHFIFTPFKKPTTAKKVRTTPQSYLASLWWPQGTWERMAAQLRSFCST